MHKSTSSPPSNGQSSPVTITALEKIPSAAKRMGLSVSSFYRTAKRDGLRVIKVSERSSAVPQEDVDAWIQARINRHASMTKAVQS